MPTDPAIAEEIQKLGLGREVILYDIDITPLGGPTLYFTPMTEDGTDMTSIAFGGQEYTPFPIMAEGFSWKAGEPPAQPTVSVSNINHALTSYILTYGNLLGAKFIRTRTFEKFLDEGDSADSSAYLPQDVFRFERKVYHDETSIVWEMSSWIDQQGVMLPKQMVVRDYCPLRYRDGSTGTFDYTKASCPYTGSSKFDSNDEAVATVAEDVCSHRLTGCVARFGTADLPFGGFPGVPKFRV